MNVITLTQLDNGTKIPAVSGKVHKAFPAEHKVGTTDDGRDYDFWSQSIQLADSSGQIRCSLGLNNETEVVAQGQQISISGQVGEWKGVKQLQRCKIVTAAAQKSQNAPQSSQTCPQAQRDTQSQIIRQNALSHATALVAAGKMGILAFWNFTQQCAEYSATGDIPKVKPVSGQDNSDILDEPNVNDKIDQDIPF
jgi:hypothetical protein